jgi:uncharacterized protein (DUF2252 family)
MGTHKRVDRLRTTMRKSSVADRMTAGAAARERRPRSGLATWQAPADRPDPVDLLTSQEGARLPLLVPVRHARMAVSAFTFYRGSAIIMASDLGSMPDTGIITQLCGDAHLANFGMFGAPDRSLVFDVNDFDETNPGPFEWDVMRLATSFVLAGRDIGLPESVTRDAAAKVGEAYRTQIATYAGMTDLAVWYDRIDVGVMSAWAKDSGLNQAEKTLQRNTAKARTRDTWSAISKMTEVVDGRRQFLNKPPLLIRVPLDDRAAQVITDLVVQYQDTLLRDRALLLNHYHVLDVAHKVVGVGSVGLRAFVLLMQGRDPDDLMVLQAKEAVQSVLEPFTHPSAYSNMGQRVVVGQQIMQAASDVFLGWVESFAKRDFYIRQLRDMKFSPDPTGFTSETLVSYAALCARGLARAHARSGDPVAINGYLGTSTKFDKAIRDFSLAYADQVTSDYARYTAAIADGSIKVADESKPANYSFVVDPTRGVELVDADAASEPPASS